MNATNNTDEALRDVVTTESALLAKEQAIYRAAIINALDHSQRISCALLELERRAAGALRPKVGE